MSRPVPRPGIMDIHAYQPGESKIPGIEKVIKLASNESPVGPSPKALDAIRNNLKTLELYPDGSATEVRQALAQTHGLDADKIMCTGGSEEMLHLIVKAYAGLGDEVIYSQYGFIAYRIAILATGATPIIAPEQNFTTDIDAILAAVTERTKLVFLANPNNPTGTYLPFDDIKRLRDKLPAHIILVLDAAYAEYSDKPDYDPGTSLVDNGQDNVVVTRTFSKIYGLASLRIGWTYCPPAIRDVLNRIRSTFNVTMLAQVAAVASLADEQHLEKAKAHNLKWLPWVKEELEKIGLPSSDSIGNFLLVHFPGGPDQAKAADQYLRRQGLIVRPVAGYGLAQCLRVTIGRDDENKALVAALSDFMAEA